MKQKKKIIALVLMFVVLLGMLAVLLLNLLPKESEEVVKTAWRPEVEWYDEDGTEFTITTAEQL